MTTTTTAISQHRPTDHPLLSQRGLLLTLVLGAAFVFVFYSFLLRMARMGIADPDWSHIFLIPLISLYFLFQRKREILEMPTRLYWPGLALLCGGIINFAMGIYPHRNDMAQGYSMVMALFGLVMFFNGPRRMSILWLPVIYLVFSVVISQGLWLRISFPLQLIAANAGATLIQAAGLVIDIDARVAGSNILVFDGQRWLEPLGVEEACSGLKMLMTFVALGVALAFISTHRRWWQRLVIVASTVPVAIFINVLRVAVLAYLYAKVDPAYARGEFHIMIGLLMLLPAAGIFLLLGWIMDKIIIEDRKPVREKLGTPAGVLARMEHERKPWNWKSMFLGLAAGGGVVLATGGMLLLVVLVLLHPISRISEALVGESAEMTMMLSAGLVFLAIVTPAFIALHLLQRRLVPRPMMAGPLAIGLVAAILLGSGLGLRAAIDQLGLVLFKERLPMRGVLTDIPRQIGTWQMVNQHERLPPDIENTLGTTLYITRDYEDTSRTDRAGRFARVHLAYYSGTVDTVPHVPERCFIGGGHASAGVDRVPITLSGNQYRERDIGPEQPSRMGQTEWVADVSEDEWVRVPRMDFRATRFNFAPQTNPDTFTQTAAEIRTVIYFFVADGDFHATAFDVRRTAFEARNRYAYYCKVEVQILDVVDDPELAQRRSEEFLSELMPHVLRILPDWVEVQEGRYPRGESEDD
ncbi:MAG: exosortase/archaeosortase family protein [Phycisphaeraceae bacterium]|nr:exosortase/archaeosortase family protein [Phycisphaeraceae bacterium]